jgi:uncharacterized protein YrrD
MPRSVNGILGFSMHASDGEIGKVKELYFNDQNWLIRYLIVETGNWLSYRKVLISPVALKMGSGEYGSFLINFTKDQIRNSPDIDTDRPVSRQQEVGLFGFYAWPAYWDGGFYENGVLNTPDSGSIPDTTYDRHLRSTLKISGYHIHATDGVIGHVSDFIVDENSWNMIYFVVDTKNWIGGVKVLIPVEDVREISWVESAVYLNVSMDKVKGSRPFNPIEFSNPEPSFEKEGFA